MTVSLQIGLKQTQKFALTQSLRQSIEMLQLSSLELADVISEELTANPVLEEENSNNLLSSEDEAILNELNQRLTGDNTLYEKNEQQRIDFADVSDAGYSGVMDDDDRKRQFIENAVMDGESLAEHLTGQIRVLSIDETLTNILLNIATSLDDNGFFLQDKEQFATENNIEIEKLNKAFDILYNLDPVGCGSTTVQEALVLQAKSVFPKDNLLHTILVDYFDNLVGLFYDKIAKALSISENDIIDKSKLIQSLDPYPGREYTRNKPRYIQPEMSVKYIDDEIILTFYDEYVPKIKISSYYRKLIQQKSIDKKSLEYIKEKINAAKYLMKNINNRRNTIEKVVKAIMERQVEFLLKGPGHLKPLIHAEIAEQTGFHESTISRVTTNKYIQTSWGVLELKYFFVTKLKSEDSNDDRSTDEALKLIQDIITKENKEKPFSDDEIVKKLDNVGIKVARRTVAKYRGILGLASSSKRKRLYMIKKEANV